MALQSVRANGSVSLLKRNGKVRDREDKGGQVEEKEAEKISQSPEGG